MKVQILEYDSFFSLRLEAENLAEAAWVARFGSSKTKKLNYADATANKDGTFCIDLGIGKSKRWNGGIGN